MAKFNFRSSQGSPAAQGPRIHKEDIPGCGQKRQQLPAVPSRLLPAEEFGVGVFTQMRQKEGSNERLCLWARVEGRPGRAGLALLLAAPARHPEALCGALPLSGPRGDPDLSCSDVLFLGGDFKTFASSLPEPGSLTPQCILEPML